MRALFEALDDVEVIVGSEELGTPEAAIGDTFCTYAPGDGTTPSTMPFATIVTRNVSGWDAASDLDRVGAFRVNLNVGRAHVPEEAEPDFARRDHVLPHPNYATQGWISIIEPADATDATLGRLLELAHDRAATRHRGGD